MDFQRLFKLRLVVARFGEMDGAQWWNTTGALARIGNSVLSRGFPRTDFFAQARIVFEVARWRCREVFNHPRSITLWDLPVELEDQLESEYQRWSAAREVWVPFFSKLQSQNREDLFTAFVESGLMVQNDKDSLAKLRRGVEGKSVPIPGKPAPDDKLVNLLALGFCRAEKRTLLVPFATEPEGAAP
jgi:hypothetical protein